MKIKEIIVCMFFFVILVLIRSFVITPIRVDGDSMNNTLMHGDLMILNKYNKKNIKRFDIVVINLNGDNLIKRVIGLPKEDIEYKDGILYIDNNKLDENFGFNETEDFKAYCAMSEYFVIGDNRNNSLDSRVYGCISSNDILGTVNFRFFPFKKFGNVK